MGTADEDTSEGPDDAGADRGPEGEPRYLDATTTGPTPPVRSGAWLVAAGLVVAVVLVVALVAVTRSPTDDSATPTTTTAPAPDDDGQQATEEISVAAPYDGKASMRLPITVTPNRDLVDGQTVTVSGSGFPPGADIGVLMCTNEAVFDGIAACDIGTAISSVTGPGITADTNGSFSVLYRVQFHFTVADPDATGPAPGTSIVAAGTDYIATSSNPSTRQIDCGAGDIDPDVWPTVIPPTAESDPGGFTCIIAAGMVRDYDRSGGAAIGAAGAQFRSFDESERHAPPTLAPPVAPEPATATSLVGELPTTSTSPPGMVTTTFPTYPPYDPTTTTTGPPPDQEPLDPGSTTTTGASP
jgi:hypothetical protein